MGIIAPSAPMASWRSSQQSRTSSMRAISAIEQPAARLGSMTCCSGELRMSAVSAIKWTPQKMMNSAAACEAANWDRLNESPR